MRLDIMRTLRYEPKRILRVSMETNQSYLPLRTNLEFMTQKGLIGMSRIPSKSRTARKYGVMVFLTRKGSALLDKVEGAYDELLGLGSQVPSEDLASAQAPSIEEAPPA